MKKICREKPLIYDFSIEKVSYCYYKPITNGISKTKQNRIYTLPDKTV